jgi:YggT family protein
MPGFSLVGLVAGAFQLYYIVLLIRVIGSWLPPRYGQSVWSQIYGLCFALTEPLLRPIRQALRPLLGGVGLDLSPLILYLLLGVVQGIVLRFLLTVVVPGGGPPQGI